MKCNFKIKGLDCANCAAELERAISKVKGVENASISFMAEKMTLEIDEANKEVVMKDVEKVIKKEEPDVTIQEV
ncbi:MAG: heavy-metal-associated domain-containing protein [Clostridia bacterium]|nr:heavy-metal-associated domain-containing protein [Clostridia bacterium]